MNKSFKRTATITMAASIAITSAAAIINHADAIDSKEKMGVNNPNVKYKDGIYYGEAIGYSYSKDYENKVRTKVVVKNGHIESIALADDEGNYRYPDTPTEGQGANGGPYKENGSNIIKFLLDGDQNVYKIADDMLFWFFEGPDNVTPEEIAEYEKRRGDLYDKYYDAIGGATITARAISVGATNALDTSREASTKKVVTKIMMKTPPKTDVYRLIRNNTRYNKSFVGNEINLDEIQYEITYSDGTNKVINYGQLKDEGFKVKYHNPETRKDIDITNEHSLLIKKGQRPYTISVSSKYGSDNFPIVGVTPKYVEDNLLYRVGEEGEFKEIPLNRENNKRNTYDVDEIVDRPSETQKQVKLNLKKSDVGDNIYFKTTKYINPANNKADGLEDKYQEFNYEPVSIKRDMASFEINRRGATSSNVPGATFAFGKFQLSAIVEDDTQEQKDALIKIVDTIKAAQAKDSMPKEQKDNLEEAKKLIDNADKVLSEKKSSSATFKKTRVELEKKYNEYLNYGKEKPEPGENPDNQEPGKEADKLVVVNKDALKSEIDKAENLKSDIKYKNDTKEDREAFDNALAKAKEVYENKDAKQKDVDKAKADLVDTMSKIDGKEVTPKPGEDPNKSNPKPTPDKKPDEPNSTPDQGKKPDKPKPSPGGSQGGSSSWRKDNSQNTDDLDKLNGEIDFEVEALKDKRTVKTQRVSGQDRFATSVNISKMAYDKADTVVLVNGFNNADALTAAPYANSLKAPILLVDKNNIPSVVKEEIKRLGVKNVVIIGGEAVVGNEAIKDIDGVKVERIAGGSRYETSAMVADKLIEKDSTNRAVLVSGEHMVDALSIPSMAKRYQGAVLLTKNNELNDEVGKFISKHSIKEATIIGGNVSISREVEKELASKKISIMRIAGKDRYETSKKLIEASLRERKLVGDKEVVVASGENLADALAIGPYAYKDNAMILISKDGDQMEVTKKTIERAGFKKVTLVGGISSISDKLKTMFRFGK